MAISDLLWACPECGRIGGVDPAGTCQGCGTAFSRGRGALIRALMPDGRLVERSPAEWSDRLPDPAVLLKGDGGAGEDSVVRHARVLAREVTGVMAVRGEGREFLNRVERFGPKRQGTLELGPDRLTYRPEGGGPREWPFDALTAIQASSSTLQVKARGQPLVAFRFLDDSVFLWETLLHAALRAFYRRTGRGEIIEFQPRIVAR
jgi:hypothetical protein